MDVSCYSIAVVFCFVCVTLIWSAVPSTASEERSEVDSKKGGEKFSLELRHHYGVETQRWKVCQLQDTKQSPVQLLEKQAEKIIFRPIQLDDYNKNLGDAILFNDGQTAAVSFKPGYEKHGVPTLSGGALGWNEFYRFEKMRFKWGRVDNNGADHVIDGNGTHPLEVQFVHYNKKFANYEEALQRPDGIAVLSFVFQLSNKKNDVYERITSRLDEIRHASKIVTIKEFPSLQKFFPGHGWNWDYYAYHGTLTPPHCYESVTWMVSRTPLKIHSEQVENFRKLVGYAGESLASTTSPTVGIGCRNLYLSMLYKMSPEWA